MDSVASRDLRSIYRSSRMVESSNPCPGAERECWAGRRGWVSAVSGSWSEPSRAVTASRADSASVPELVLCLFELHLGSLVSGNTPPREHSVEECVITKDRAVGILGTGSYLPKEEISNVEVAERVGVTMDWIERKTQILTRRYAAPSEATSDLATRAAEGALEQAGISVDQVAYIIVSTSTPDSPQPPTAALVQHALGAHNAACFDINVVCSGFVYGIELARALLATRPGAHALVIGADVYSRVLNFDDRATSVLLGDGAGAVVLGPVRAGYGVIETGLHTRGDARDLIEVRAGGSRLPTSHETVDAGGHYFTMQGRKVSEFVLDEVPPAIVDLLERANIRTDEIDHFIPHQPNGNLLDDLVTKAGLDSVTTHRTLEKYGNVGSACIPVTLDEANRAGAIKDGDLILLAAFGGGMSIGTCLLRWSA